MKRLILCILTISSTCLADLKQDKLNYAMSKKLKPLHTELSEPKPGDWLASHKEEGQTFPQYRKQNPIKATKTRNVIYLQPLGNLNKTHKEVIKITGEVLSAWYGLEVKTKKQMSLSSIPSHAERINEFTGQKQFLTSYLLHDVLYKKRPKDACCYLGLTATDLWPRPGWNFVFGSASLKRRVGIWSLARYGSYNKEDGSYTQFLRRTLKTAIHETGHMFSMKHCTFYECLMCGSNSLEESDRRPMRLCPQCLPKVSYATNVNLIERFKKLQQLFTTYNLTEEATYCQKALELIQTKPNL